MLCSIQARLAVVGIEQRKNRKNNRRGSSESFELFFVLFRGFTHSHPLKWAQNSVPSLT